VGVREAGSRETENLRILVARRIEREAPLSLPFLTRASFFTRIFFLFPLSPASSIFPPTKQPLHLRLRGLRRDAGWRNTRAEYEPRACEKSGGARFSPESE